MEAGRMERENRRDAFGIDGFTLKCMAMACMFIDHTGAVLFPQYRIMRIIGRLAFPIYCFLLVEGAVYTRDIRKYELRLLGFALISEIPFDLAIFGRIYWGHQNVFFTLFLGVAAIDLIKKSKRSILRVLIAAAMILAADALCTDYGGAGIVFVVCYYFLHEKKTLRHAMFAVENFLIYGPGIQTYASFAVIPMMLYNGKRGFSIKYVFYVFYPLHLLILYLISRYTG